MDKLHATGHPINDLLRRRWSPRAFNQKPVEQAKLMQLLEAARWSSSCFNAQPWRFIIATKDQPADYKKMLACLVEKNQEWAGAAPVLMIGYAALNFPLNGKPNRHALYDLGQAVANMVFEATDLDLFAHQMAGFSVERTRETYALPADVEPIVAIALGYLGDPATLPEDLRQRETAAGERKPIEQMLQK